MVLLSSGYLNTAVFGKRKTDNGFRKIKNRCGNHAGRLQQRKKTNRFKLGCPRLIIGSFYLTPADRPIRRQQEGDRKSQQYRRSASRVHNARFAEILLFLQSDSSVFRNDIYMSRTYKI